MTVSLFLKWIEKRDSVKGFEYCGHLTENSAKEWKRIMETKGYTVKIVDTGFMTASGEQKIYGVFRRKKERSYKNVRSIRRRSK